ncbi:unnamed protein product [Symbiodinium sp. CCMP2592]|nr:unnamed protein product [Symbiodinium sp. CCMP2592]
MQMLELVLRLALVVGAAAGHGRLPVRRLQAMTAMQTPFPASCMDACPELQLANGTFRDIYDYMGQATFITHHQYITHVAAFVDAISGLLCSHRSLAECIAANPGSCDAFAAGKRRLQAPKLRQQMRMPSEGLRRTFGGRLLGRRLEVSNDTNDTGDNYSEGDNYTNYTDSYDNSSSGGYGNYSDGYDNSSSGGYDNYSDSSDNSSSGGYGNYSDGYDNSSSGDYGNYSDGYGNSSSGGYGNYSDGYDNYSSGYDNYSSGGYGNYSDGYDNYSSGGYDNYSSGYDNYSSGGYGNYSGGYDNYSSGGYDNYSSGYDNYSSGGYGKHSDEYDNYSSGGYGNHTDGYNNYTDGSGDHQADSELLRECNWGMLACSAGNMQLESGDDALNLFMEFVTMTNMSMENVTTLCSAPLLNVFGLGSKDTLKTTCIND